MPLKQQAACQNVKMHGQHVCSGGPTQDSKVVLPPILTWCAGARGKSDGHQEGNFGKPPKSNTDQNSADMLKPRHVITAGKPDSFKTV